MPLTVEDAFDQFLPTLTTSQRETESAALASSICRSEAESGFWAYHNVSDRILRRRYERARIGPQLQNTSIVFQSIGNNRCGGNHPAQGDVRQAGLIFKVAPPHDICVNTGKPDLFEIQVADHFRRFPPLFFFPKCSNSQ